MRVTLLFHLTSIRKDILSKRNHLSETYCAEASHQICKKIKQHQNFIESQHIALYWPVANEVDLRSLINTIQQQHKTCYLPVLHPFRARILWFYPLQDKHSMVTNKYGIPEPIVKDIDNLTAPWELDLVLAPLVAFDQNNNRIGMGAGFYDTTFAFRKKFTKPKLIGSAYSCQFVENIDANPWDINMDAIIDTSTR